MTDEQLELHERITAGRLLSLAAARISEQIGAFGSWLLVGVGAAYSLVLANLDAVQHFISLESIRGGLLLLLAAVVFGVFQRWLAAIIATAAAASEKSEAIGRELSERNVNIDFKVVFREMERGIYYPAKWIVRRSFEKAMSGDFAASGRLSARIAQIQGLLVLVQVGFAVAAIAACAFGVKV